MACVCGTELVDGDAQGLRCLQCGIIFHAKCCNVRKAEFHIIKKCFKCKYCLTSRRLSVTELPVLGNGLENDAAAKITDFGNINSSDNVNNERVVENVSNVNEVEGHLPVVVANQSSAEITNSTADSIAMLDAINVINNKVDEINKKFDREITTQVLFDEILLLKADNIELKKSIANLQDANRKLVSRLESRECFGCPCKSFDHAKETYAHSTANSKVKLSNKSKTSTKSNINNADVNARNNIVLVPNNNKSTVDVTSASTSRVKDIGSSNSGSPTIDGTAEVILDGTSQAAGESSQAENKILSYAAVTNSSIAVTNAVINSSNTVVGETQKSANMGLSINGNKRKSVVGSCITDELSVFAKFKWIHLSSFNSSVSPDDIISYISKHANVDAKNFVCYKLVKNGVDVNALKFVNFKLGVLSNLYNDIFDASLWPANIKLRPFNFLERTTQPKPV